MILVFLQGIAERELLFRLRMKILCGINSASLSCTCRSYACSPLPVCLHGCCSVSSWPGHSSWVSRAKSGVCKLQAKSSTHHLCPRTPNASNGSFTGSYAVNDMRPLKLEKPCKGKQISSSNTKLGSESWRGCWTSMGCLISNQMSTLCKIWGSKVPNNTLALTSSLIEMTG